MEEKIRDISGFLLIVHGKKVQLCTAMATIRHMVSGILGQDTVVPWTHGQELFETCTRRKRLVVH